MEQDRDIIAIDPGAAAFEAFAATAAEVEALSEIPEGLVPSVNIIGYDTNLTNNRGWSITCE